MKTTNYLNAILSSIVQNTRNKVGRFNMNWLTILLLIPIGSKAQFTGSLSSTESTCQSNGSVTLTGCDPTSIYILTGPGTNQQTATGCPFTWTDLQTGTFTVTELKDDNTEATASIFVPGNYEQNWQFTADVQLMGCSNGNVGSVQICVTGIINATLAQQRPPYVYRISAANGTLPTNGQPPPPYGNTNCWNFPSSVMGSSFQIQTMDACGNFKTFTISVPSFPPPPQLGLNLDGYADCSGNAFYTACGSGGTAPYQFKVIAGPDQVGDIFYPANPCKQYIFKPNSTYTLEVRDECGGTAQQSFYVGGYNGPCISIAAAEGSCGRGHNGEGQAKLYYCICKNGIGPYSVHITSTCGYDITINNSPECYYLPDWLDRPCTYTFEVTDGCGFTAVNTYTLDGTSTATLSCGGYATCPASGDDKIIWYNYYSFSSYVATQPLTIDIKDSGGNSISGYPSFMNGPSQGHGWYENYQALIPGDYTYKIVDSCGISCSGIFSVPRYVRPTVTVDQTQKCFGAGVALVCGVNGNPLNPTYYNYQIVAPSPDQVGAGPDYVNSPPNKGWFPRLTSGGDYFFQFYDGCQAVVTDIVIPTWVQPTWEVGYGLICEPATQADLQIINLQPDITQIVGPYTWQILSISPSGGGQAYYSTPPYNGTLPYPNSTGQTSMTFPGLPAQDNGPAFATQTYNILGFDACGNSYQNSGKVGLFPDEELILDKYNVCADALSKVKARVSNPIIGATYEYYRDGILVATSNKLFTTIQPAYPGTYTVKVLAGNPVGQCIKVSPGKIVVADGILVVTNPPPICPGTTTDITLPAVTAGSSPGTLSYWKDSLLTISLPNPTMVTPGKYWIQLITSGPPVCNLQAPVIVETKGCIFDLALKKELLSAGPFTPGSNVTFNITVYNQGEVDAYNINVTDYIPSGMSLSDGNWIGSPNATLVTPIAFLGVGQNTVIPITLKIDANFMGATIRNWAEISSADNDTDPNNTPPTDIDSDPDGINFNQPGETNDLNDDNVINQNGKTGGDEDDHDPAEINVQQVFDLALKKELLSSGTFSPGSDVTFKITVYNQGTLDATSVQVTDYIPSGMTLNDANWTGSPNATLVTPITNLAAGASTTVNITLKVNANFMGTTLRNWAEISSATNALNQPDIDSDPDGINFNQPGETNDLNDDNVINQNGKTGGDEDDHDPAEINVQQVFDLALKKELLSSGNFVPGSDVTFKITVYNQGTLDATSVQVTDYIPTGMSLNDANWTGSPNATLVTPITNLAAGASTTVNITLKVNANFMGTTLRNWAEISSATNALNQPDIDSDPDGINFNQPGETDDLLDDNVIDQNGKTGGDEDDHDPAEITVQQTFDLALRKVLTSSGTFIPGNNVTFRITVFNQGTLDGTNIQVTDYIPSGMILNDPNWSVSGSKATLINPIASLAAGDSTAVFITLKIDVLFQGTSLRNWAEISAASNALNQPDIDSKPNDNNFSELGETNDLFDDNVIDQNGNAGGDEDDHDPAEISVLQYFDLALKKVVGTAGPYQYNQLVDFKIWVYNQGTLIAKNIQVSDYIPSGYSFSLSDNPNWAGASPLATYTIPGPLNPYDSTMITIRLKLLPNPSSASALVNYAEISAATDGQGNTVPDIDSKPDQDITNDNGGDVNTPTDDLITDDGTIDEDDHDPATIQIWDLAIKKTLATAGPYAYGQNLVFPITVYNQGTQTAKDVVVSDYIPAGYTFNGGSNPLWSGVAPTVSITVPGPIAPGNSVTVNLILQLEMTIDPKGWFNYAEITASKDSLGIDRSNDDVDSKVGSNGPNEKGVTPGGPGDDDINSISDTGLGSQDDHDPAGPWIFDLATIIENDDDYILAYGENVTFPIKVKNQGNIPSAGYELSVNVPKGFAFSAGNNPGWNYNAITGVATLIVPATDTIYPGEMDMYNIILTAQPAPVGVSPATAWTVEIEISKDKPVADEVGIKDIDSKPDANFTNDAGGNPIPDSEGGNFPGSDDILTGNGTGNANDTNAVTDEDDNDPEYVQVFDLALRKTFVQPSPLAFGQTHTFTITVFNQGNVAATNVVVKDYIPAGYTFAANNGWTGAAPTISQTIAGPIAPGDSSKLTLDLTFIAPAGPTDIKTWANYSEIADAKDGQGNPVTDVDSKPGSNGPNENNILPGKPGDDDINSISDTGFGSQDDHDPAGPWVFDLATIIENDDDYILAYGENVTFPIKVKNQGNIPSAGYELSVNVPKGFAFSAGNNPGWNYNAITGVATLIVPATDTIYPGEMDMYNIILTAQPAPVGVSPATAWTVEIEISKDKPVADEVGIKDIDSKPDANFTNDAGGNPIPDSEGGNFPGSDDILTGNGTGNANDTNAATDEDDNDPEYVQVFDLALRKTFVQPSPLAFGQTHTFTITVFNQGNVAATNVVVKDYIPAGYTFASNNGWTGAAPTISHTIAGPIAPGDSSKLTLDLTFIAPAGPTDVKTWANYSEIADAKDGQGNPVTDVDSDPGSNGPNENNILPGKPGDDDINSISDTGLGSQDDHDPAGPWVFDLATIIENDDDYILAYGENVTFPIKVKNQGNIPSAGYELSVNVPKGFAFSAGNNPGWNYNAITGVATLIVPATDTIYPGEMDMYNIILTAQPAPVGVSPATAWTVEIEISKDKPVADEVGIKDIDSKPDANFTNDAGGNPIPDSEGGNFPGSDDILTGNGTGNANDTNAVTDEDDNDPEYVQVFDLALRKTFVQPSPLVYGQTHTFTITVFNQGNVAATNVVVKDYIPAGYTFAANNGWTGAAPTISQTIAGPIAPGDSSKLTLDLTFIAPAGPTDIKTWANYSEIADAKDGQGNPVTDVDSDPGSNGPNENNILPGKPGDDDINSISDTGFGSQDDHDPAGPWVFDLATIIENDDDYILAYGENVTFPIKVKNQGNIPSAGYTLSVNVPVGFTFDVNLNTGWVYNNISHIATYTVSALDTIYPGEMDMYSLVLSARPVPIGTATATAWTVEIEISKDKPVADEVGIKDIDSKPDANFTNDAGGNPIPDSEGGNFPGSDDILNGNGTGNPNDTNAATDEDDNDPEYVQLFDLALKKTLTNVAPYHYGDIHTFKVTIYNQGNVPATNIVINDYVPNGYTFTANNGWTGVAPTISKTITSIILPGDSLTISLDLTFVMATTPSSNKSWINYSEIASATDTQGNPVTDVDSKPGSNGPNENNVIPGKPGDDDITSNSDTELGSQDDHDPAGPWVFDLATIIENNVNTVTSYGEKLTFPIKVKNQGNIASAGYTLSVDVPDGFKFNASDNPNWTYNSGTGIATLIIAATDTIYPGEMDMYSLILESQPVAPGQISSDDWTVEIEISADRPVADEVGIKDVDSKPDTDFTNDAGGNPNPDSEGGNFPGSDDILNGDGTGAINGTVGATDEDDNDPEFVKVHDLALRKYLVTGAPYTYGQVLTFNINIFNQGNVALKNIKIQDYIPAGYSFDPSNTPLWSLAGSTASMVYAGTLLSGDSASVQIKLVLLMNPGSYKAWDNYAEIAQMFDTTGVDVSLLDVDSKPGSDGPGERAVEPGDPADNNITSINKGGEEDDHDPAAPEIFDLALRKVIKGGGPYKYGDIIPFEITVFNQGNIATLNPEVTDYVPAGFEFVAASNASWTYTAGNRQAVTNYIGKIVPGDSGKVTIKLKVIPNLTDVKAWYNLAEISEAKDTTGTPKTDIDSNPDKDKNNDGTPKDDKITDPNDSDDHDPAEPEILDFALRKWVLNEKLFYLPGETVDFTISLHNQGNVASQNLTIRDYIPNGFTFAAINNPGWSVVGSNLEYTYGNKLLPKDSVQIHLKLVVIIPSSNVTPFSWENYGEISNVIDTLQKNRNNDDADSNPGSDSPRERMVHDGDPWDNVIDGNGTTDGGNEDEDDHDPEKVTVTAYLGDKVWKDNNGNGVQDLGEPGIKNVEVILYDCKTGTIVKKDTTDINGEYGFEALLSGDYFVRFVNPDPEKCGFTFKDKGGNDRTDNDANQSGITDCTHLDWGERDSTVDAGLVLWASYGDYTWHDRNANGLQEVGEEPIPGVKVTLYDADTKTPIRTQITDANGLYHFTKLLPGNYYAKFEADPMWNLTDPNTGNDLKDSDVDGSNGSLTNATTYLSPGEDDLSWDAGYWKCSMIGGRVFFDLNMDGIFQDTENGINGLEVYLVNAITGVVVTKLLTQVDPKTVSNDGYYKFACIKPGSYYVRFERPGHLAASNPFKGGNPNKDSDIGHENGVNTTRVLNILSDNMILNIGAGFQTKATVGDYVWLDANFNGLQDSGEQSVEGIKVYAINSNGTIVSESQTQTDGHYTLDGIAQGDYFVKFDPPANYGFTIAHSGSDDIDNDADGTNGFGTTRTYRINAGDDRPSIDAGLVFQVLPLEWLSFEGRYNGSFTELDWKTGVELNNDHFEVERRHESEVAFAKIATVNASADGQIKLHEYDYDDYDVTKSGIYYYRIKQVDKNGIKSYSRVISIKVDAKKDLSLSIYPNPTDEVLYLDLGIGEDTDLSVSVYDESGKNVLTNPFGGYRKAGNYREVLNTQLLAAGQYNLQIKTTSGLINKRFTVAR